MFKFDEYPEIKKAHKTSEKFDALTYKKEFAYEKSDKNEDRKKWATSIKNEKDFNKKVYASVIFDVFSKIKPVLKIVRTGEMVGWDSCYGETFEELDERQRKTLYMMVELERPYRLPDEYYDERDWYEESKNLKAVQKK